MLHFVALNVEIIYVWYAIDRHINAMDTMYNEHMITEDGEIALLSCRDDSPEEYFMSVRCSRPTRGSANTEQFASASAALIVLTFFSRDGNQS